MADRPIGSLTAASVVNEKDLFVLEQDGSAKKLTGEVLKVWLLKLAEGKGGIKGIAKTGSNGLNDTYRITFADGSTFDYSIANGKSITGIAKTGTSGLVDTYTISYNDGSKQTYTVTNGAKGDPGTSYYVWIKWSDVPPSYEYFTMGDIPGKYMGVYSGTAEKPPEDWKEYMWVKVEGKTAYQFAKDGGYTGTEEQFTKKMAFEHTTHLLNAESDIDRCIETGMYYLTGDSQTIDSLVSKAGIVHPVPVEYSLTGLVPKAVFVEVTKGSTEWSDPQNPVGQPHQHLRIYYGTSEVNQENPGVSYEFSFDRVHNVVGYEADGSSWGAWRSASKNAYTLEQERGKVYGPWAFDAYDQNLDNMNEPGATYSMFVDDNMRSKYPNLFSAINDMPAYRAVMRVGKRVDGGELFQEMVIYHRTVVGGVTTYATVNATRLLYGEPGERGWKVGKANLYGTGTGSSESAAPDTLIVEYGVTTVEELAEAVGVYKHIFCRNGDILLPMTKANTPYSFAGVVADQSQANRLVNYTIGDGEWVSYERYVSDEITEDSEDIPTASAVYYFTKDMQNSFLVTVTETQTGPNMYEYSSDKKYKEIEWAINSGKEVVARCMRYYGRNKGYQYYMYWRRPDPGCFTFRSVLDNSGTYEEFSICGNESCYLNKFELPILKTTAQELTDAQKEQVRKNIGAGTASEWSDLGEAVTNLGDTLTWDGNTEGKAEISIMGMPFYKVSDTPIPFGTDLSTAVMTVEFEGTEYSGAVTSFEDSGILCIQNDYGYVASVYDSATAGIPTGIYFFSGMTLTIPGYNFTESTIKPVPEKYLPEVTELTMVSPGGKKFKVTVDDSGTLTATEV